MTQKEREQAARAIFKTYEETEAKLSKIASKAREYVRKIDAAIEDEEKKISIKDAAIIYQCLENIEGAKRVAQQVIKLINRARIDGTKEDFKFIAVRLELISMYSKEPLERIEELMPLFD
jgi:hypothetical protein